jgi:hypothetical protein
MQPAYGDRHVAKSKVIFVACLKLEKKVCNLDIKLNINFVTKHAYSDLETAAKAIEPPKTPGIK